MFILKIAVGFVDFIRISRHVVLPISKLTRSITGCILRLLLTSRLESPKRLSLRARQWYRIDTTRPRVSCWTSRQHNQRHLSFLKWRGRASSCLYPFSFEEEGHFQGIETFTIFASSSSKNIFRTPTKRKVSLIHKKLLLSRSLRRMCIQTRSFYSIREKNARAFYTPSAARSLALALGALAGFNGAAAG